MHYFKNITYALIASLLLFSACGEDDPEPVGNAPIANAGADLDAKVNSSVTLNGTGSSDTEGAITYSWALTTVPSGSSASVNNPTQATATFTPDVEGTYVATLTVTDTDNNKVSDATTITVTEAAGDPPVAVILDQDSRIIREDNNNNKMTVGTSYALDGSSSSDLDTDSRDLTFLWEVARVPASSSTARVTAVSGNPDEAVFVPDVVGDFTIRLTVSDPEGNVATDEVVIESNADPVVISRNITETTVWKNVFANPALPDYFVMADIDVTAQLTVAPGVTVMFEPNRGLSIEGNSGALVAIGKADSLVVFTAQDTLNGWDGIVFFNNNAQNEFNYADVSYGGQLDFGFGVLAANIGVERSAGVKVSNSTVSNSFNYGIYLENGGTLRESANNTLSDNNNNPIALSISQVGSLDEQSVYSGNTDNTVEIFASTLSQDEELVVPALSNGTSYYVSGKLDIDSGIKAQPGSSFEFNTNALIEISGTNGYFSAEGTAADSITFTARNPADGWGGFSIFTSNSNNSFKYARVSYGGGRDFGFGIRSSNIGVERFGSVKITNSVISNSVGDYGLYLEEGGTIAEFSENRFTGNDGLPIGVHISTAGVLDAATTFSGNGDNSVEIYASTLAATNDDQTLVAFADGTPYYVSGRLDIDGGLEIEPGATLEFNKDVRIEVSGSDGFLDAEGTAGSLITFAARVPADGWLGVIFFTNTVANKMIYTNISYGGRGSFGFGVDAANIGVDRFGKVAIANSTITNSQAFGVFVESGGSSQVTNATGVALTTNAEVEGANTFTDNTSGATNLP